MKYKITKERYEKVVDEEVEIDIPEVPEYHFETGIRRSIAIIPEWTSWNKEKDGSDEVVWKLTFVCVYGSFENKVEVHSIQLHELSHLLQFDKTGRSLATFFVNHRDEYTKCTKEQFMADYNNAVAKFNQALNLDES